MKIALYIEDGFEQLVLTPATDTERALLSKLENGSRKLSIYRGEFYACEGGWTRHGFSSLNDKDSSTIIVLKPAEDAAA